MMNSQNSSASNLNKPFIYGTAWKEDKTKRLTTLALEQGFRAIDTANQRKHYHEAAVGDAIQDAIRRGLVARAELFLQTKFTFQSGQDHRLPYDPSASIADQVEQSFASSLEHLGVDYLDSYVLHGPSQGLGLHARDLEAWNAMERLHVSGRVRALGISNVSVEQLKSLLANTSTPPSYVQNRCYAVQGWGRDVRQVCLDHGITYQAFSLLTANSRILSHPTLAEIAARHHRDTAQIVFRFAIETQMIPLTGTTRAEHMQIDLQVFDFQLSSEELTKIANLV